jgi:hypothetical protein
MGALFSDIPYHPVRCSHFLSRSNPQASCDCHGTIETRNAASYACPKVHPGGVLWMVNGRLKVMDIPRLSQDIMGI